MATPKDFPESNLEFKKPEDMTDEQCSSLHVCQTIDSDGTPLQFSCWQLSPEEIKEVQRTGVVWLNVCGISHPPVSILGTSPFQH